MLCNVITSQSSLFSISLFIGSFYIISVILIFFYIPEKYIIDKEEEEKEKEKEKEKVEKEQKTNNTNNSNISNNSFDDNSKGFIKENKIDSKNLKDKKIHNFKNVKNYFIPSLYRLTNNYPFILLLTPWILDLIIMTIFAAMLPFFLNFIINPQKYCMKNNYDLNSDNCNVNIWLAYSISVFFIFCVFFTLMWHYLVKKFGKKKCWQSYSLISIFVFGLFFFCGEGSMGTLIFVSICCSIPAGGAYINDVFISDIIDYDEFICGQRNEGVFTVFSAFIPKVVSIFSQSIPLTVMTCKNKIKLN